MGTEGFCSEAQAKINLGTTKWYTIWTQDNTTSPLQAQCRNLHAQEHKKFSLILYLLDANHLESVVVKIFPVQDARYMHRVLVVQI